MSLLFEPVTLACMLMGASSALVGVIAFVRRRSLLGESLSHASYPGVIVALSLPLLDSIWMAPLVLLGALLSGLLGMATIELLERRFKIRQDAALCFVLATFFGVGLTLASRLQFSHPVAYQRTEMYLYGQAATMTGLHIWLYGALALLIGTAVALFQKEILISSFDRQYARTAGIRVRAVEILIVLLMVLAVVMGIRGVGVVLMSAMLIAPAAAARQFTHRLGVMFLLAALFGGASSVAGVYLSVAWAIPTGPAIVLVASTLCFASLLLAPERGVLIRVGRMLAFRYRCALEHALKALWRSPEAPLRRPLIKWRLRHLGLVQGGALTPQGRRRAAHIVRLHRLWEVYLVDYLGASAERVHRSAEEMEHILTPELEQELTLLLHDPKLDPHQQPIPPA